MIKNCAMNAAALEVLDSIRSQLDCSYSTAILELHRRRCKSNIDYINDAFGLFQDSIVKHVGCNDMDALLLEVVRIVMIRRSNGNCSDDELRNIIESLESLFDTQTRGKEQ